MMTRAKLWRTLRVAGLVLAGSAFFGSAAHADVDIFSAGIVRLGPDPRFEGAMIQVDDLTDTVFTGIRQYYLSATLGNAGLATMLTALSLGQDVFIRVAGTGEDGSLVTIIFLNAPTT